MFRGSRHFYEKYHDDDGFYDDDAFISHSNYANSVEHERAETLKRLKRELCNSSNSDRKFWARHFFAEELKKMQKHKHMSFA